jgi:phosphopantetheinyl transferase
LGAAESEESIGSEVNAAWVEVMASRVANNERDNARMVPTDPAPVTVFSYTGQFVDRLWPEATALRLRMSSTRRERYDRLEAKQRVLPVAALRLLELAMDHCGHATFKIADVESTTGKKPIWSGKGVDTSVDFSLSHANGAVVVAVARGAHVGIDVEPANVVAPKTMQRLMSLSAQQLPPLNEGNATARWTQVEAIVKAAGLGISHATDIEWNAEGEVHFATLNGQRWWWQPVDIDDRFTVHLAAGVPLQSVELIRMTEL